jgi:hypothetical protein
MKGGMKMKTVVRGCAAFLFFCVIFGGQVFGDIVVEVNGEAVNFTDAQPAIVGGRTMVPLRGVFEQMGFAVEWDAAASTALMRREGTVITVTIGDDFITANGERIFPDVPPQIINSRFMLPLRAVAEATGDNVAWNAANSTARITTAFAPVVPPVTPVVPPAPPTPPVQALDPSVPQDTRDEITAWITATTSILSYENNGFPGLFDLPPGNYQCLHGESIVDCAIGALRNSWSTNNASDLRNQIQSLLNGGHGARFWQEYMELSQFMAELGRNEFIRLFNAQGGAGGADLVLNTIAMGDKWGERGIVAWDMYRVGTLVSWGYVAGYIDRDEAIRLMEPAANALRVNFSNWAEATENYIDGYVWWSRGERAEQGAARLNSFRNVIPGLVPGIYNDAFFSSPPIVNGVRLNFPTAQTIVGRFVSETNARHYFEYNADGTFYTAGVDMGDGEMMTIRGNYTVLREGRVLHTYRTVEFSDYTHNFEQGIDEDYFLFFSADGSRMIAIDRYSGSPAVFLRR